MQRIALCKHCRDNQSADKPAGCAVKTGEKVEITSILTESVKMSLTVFARANMNLLLEQEAKLESDGEASRTPSSHRASNYLGRYAMYLDGDGHVTMEEVVRATFKNLFPDSFQSVLEVRNHKVGGSCM